MLVATSGADSKNKREMGDSKTKRWEETGTSEPGNRPGRSRESSWKKNRPLQKMASALTSEDQEQLDGQGNGGLGRQQ